MSNKQVSLVSRIKSVLKQIRIQGASRSFWIKVALGFTGLCFACFLFLFASIHLGVFGALPKPEKLNKIRHPQASEVYSSDGELMGRYYLQNRLDVKFADIPAHFKYALIATEDIRFYNHKGIDYKSLGRVAVKSILLRDRGAGGGSTLTQQLAKNLFGRNEFGFLSMPVNKLREMIIARRIEKLYSKNEILELYLNTVSFGENTYGLKTAAMRYFHKSPAALNISESAVLVGLLKATGLYNPNSNYNRSVLRRNIVLTQMKKYEFLEPQMADSLMRLPIELNYYPLTHNSGIAPYFRTYIKKKVEKWLEENPDVDGKPFNIHTDGLKIYTSIDSKMQRYAEAAVNNHIQKLQNEFNRHWGRTYPWGSSNDLIFHYMRLNKNYPLEMTAPLSEETLSFLNTPKETKIFTWKGVKDTLISPLDSARHHLNHLQTGFVAMDSKNGYIKAWVGGINHQFFKYDHVTAKRQTGSVFKPLVYLAAMEAGIKPCEYFANDSIVYEEYEDWTPRNADRNYGGYYSMKGALTHSINTVSVKLLMKTGIQEVIRLAKNAGITSSLPHVPSLALGSGDISLLEMVTAYTVFANEGYVISPKFITKIEDKDGTVLFEEPQTSSAERLVREESAQSMLQILKNVVSQGTASGLQTQFGLQIPIAGKTGTTQNQSDGWFIGITPGLVAGVWVGGENPSIRFRSLALGQGAHTALPVYGQFLNTLYRDPEFKNLKTETFDIPAEIIESMDCPDFSEENPDSLFKIIRKEGKLNIRNLIKNLFKRNKTD